MALKISHLDIPNSRVYFDLDGGSLTSRSVREIGSLIKQEVKLAPYADDSDIFTWSGFESLAGGNSVGIVMVMRPGWTIWTIDAGAPHRFQITQGIILGDAGADPLGSPANVIWSLAEYTVSSILGAATVDDIATILSTVNDTNAKVDLLETDLTKVQRYLGIGVKRSFVAGKLEITDEGKSTVVQRFTLDETDNPTSQQDDDIWQIVKN